MIIREEINDLAREFCWSKELVHITALLTHLLDPKPTNLTGADGIVCIYWYANHVTRTDGRYVVFTIEYDLDGDVPYHPSDPDNGVLVSLCESYTGEHHYFTILDHDVERLQKTLDLWLNGAPLQNIDMT